MSRSTRSRGEVEQAGNRGKEQSGRSSRPPSPRDMVSPPHLWRRRGSASDGAAAMREVGVAALVAMAKRRGGAWAKRQAVLVAKIVGRSSSGREEGIVGRRRDRWVAAAASR